MLTIKQEEKIYRYINNYMEDKYGEVTHCETNYVTDSYNYYDMYCDGKHYQVNFKINNNKLLIRSIKVKTL